MTSYYNDIIKDALFPKKKGVVTKSNKFISVVTPAAMTASEIRALRLSLKLSTALFAAVFNVSGKTVEAWEGGTNTPSGTALRLMQIIKKNPDILFECGVLEDKTISR